MGIYEQIKEADVYPVISESSHLSGWQGEFTQELRVMGLIIRAEVKGLGDGRFLGRVITEVDEWDSPGYKLYFGGAHASLEEAVQWVIDTVRDRQRNQKQYLAAGVHRCSVASCDICAMYREQRAKQAAAQEPE